MPAMNEHSITDMYCRHYIVHSTSLKIWNWLHQYGVAAKLRPSVIKCSRYLVRTGNMDSFSVRLHQLSGKLLTTRVWPCIIKGQDLDRSPGLKENIIVSGKSSSTALVGHEPPWKIRYETVPASILLPEDEEGNPIMVRHTHWEGT